jgi:endonuclease YncB( thermonuclease family)
MLRAGLATVYEAKTGSEFGGERMEKRYRRAEWWAKKRGKGMWKGFRGKAAEEWESPRAYKNRMALLAVGLEGENREKQSTSNSDSENRK